MVMEYPDILTDKNSHVEYGLCHSDRCQQILSLKVDGLFSVSLSIDMNCNLSTMIQLISEKWTEKENG